MAISWFWFFVPVEKTAIKHSYNSQLKGCHTENTYVSDSKEKYIFEKYFFILSPYDALQLNNQQTKIFINKIAEKV